MDPDCALAPGLFRSVPKGAHEHTVRLTYRVERGAQGHPGSSCREVEFVSPFVLGAVELRTLQGLMALAAQRAVYWVGRSWVMCRPQSEVGTQLSLGFEATGPVREGRVLHVVGSLAELARAVGEDGRSGRAIQIQRRALRRLATVTVFLRVEDWYSAAGVSGRWETKSQKRESSYRLVSGAWSGGAGGGPGSLSVAVNPALSEVAMAAVVSGQRGVKYIRMDMREVRALQLGAARLIHQRLCAWIDPGGSGKVMLSTLCRYVWHEKAPSPNAGKWRRKTVRKALRELTSFEQPWRVDEYERGKFAITRPVGLYEVNTEEIAGREAPEEEVVDDIDGLKPEECRSVQYRIDGVAVDSGWGGQS